MHKAILHTFLVEGSGNKIFILFCFFKYEYDVSFHFRLCGSKMAISLGHTLSKLKAEK